MKKPRDALNQNVDLRKGAGFQGVSIVALLHITTAKFFEDLWTWQHPGFVEYWREFESGIWKSSAFSSSVHL